MRCDLSLRLLTTWLAALAMLLAAIAPAISHAGGAPVAADWLEVCSVSGAKWLSASEDPSESAPDPRHPHTLSHCPCCALHADFAVLPASPVMQATASTGQPVVPAAFLAAPRTAHAWLSAQPRAPPKPC